MCSNFFHSSFGRAGRFEGDDRPMTHLRPNRFRFLPYENDSLPLSNGQLWPSFVPFGASFTPLPPSRSCFVDALQLETRTNWRRSRSRTRPASSSSLFRPSLSYSTLRFGLSLSLSTRPLHFLNFVSLCSNIHLAVCSSLSTCSALIRFAFDRGRSACNLRIFFKRPVCRCLEM